MENVTLLNVNESNIDTHPQRCFMKAEDNAVKQRNTWLQEQFKHGLMVKNLYVEGQKQCAGYIEYTPGEHAWRAVHAPDYLFIHCIWMYPNANKERGYGSLLLAECEKDAEKLGKKGVAVVASEGSFMAGKALFEKNGFIVVDQAKPSYSLLIKPKKEEDTPYFTNWEDQLNNCQGVHMLYSDQCPWIVRFMNEVKPVIKQYNLDLTITKITKAEDVQQGPSVYGVFSLIKDGKLLADHYISLRRFENIVKKQILK